MVPGLDLATVDPDLLRQEVPFSGPYHPGTVVVSVPERRLYLVLPGGRAMRYAVGVGRTEALDFRGWAVIGRKAEWPRWASTQNMIEHMPRYAPYAGGMAGGIDNPLGARALYLYRGNRDTDFRLHGTTPRPSASRCRAAASACSITTSSTSIAASRSAPGRGAAAGIIPALMRARATISARLRRNRVRPTAD